LTLIFRTTFTWQPGRFTSTVYFDCHRNVPFHARYLAGALLIVSVIDSFTSRGANVCCAQASGHGPTVASQSCPASSAASGRSGPPLRHPHKSSLVEPVQDQVYVSERLALETLRALHGIATRHVRQRPRYPRIQRVVEAAVPQFEHQQTAKRDAANRGQRFGL